MALLPFVEEVSCVRAVSFCAFLSPCLQTKLITSWQTKLLAAVRRIHGSLSDEAVQPFMCVCAMASSRMVGKLKHLTLLRCKEREQGKEGVAVLSTHEAHSITALRSRAVVEVVTCPHVEQHSDVRKNAQALTCIN